jgi:hypothetical protein
MLCANCGGNTVGRNISGSRIKLRPTGRPDEPFVVVCDRCGGDVEASSAGSSPARGTVGRPVRLPAPGPGH